MLNAPRAKPNLRPDRNSQARKTGRGVPLPDMPFRRNVSSKSVGNARNRCTELCKGLYF